MLSLIDALKNEETDLRRDFQGGFDRLVDALATEGALTRAVGEGRRALVRSGMLEKIVFRLAAGLRNHLRDRIAADSEALAVPVAELIRDLPPEHSPTPPPAPNSTPESPRSRRG